MSDAGGRFRALVGGAALLVAVSAALTGCSSTGLDTPTTASPSTRTPASAAGDRVEHLEVGGHDRTFILHVPPTTPAHAVPLVLVFHGADDTAAATVSETDFEKAADDHGMAVAFLQGYANTWNEGAGHTPAEQAGVDDVAFTSAALTKLESLVDVDPAKIAAVGFSNGGLLVDDLGCRLASRLDLVVPVAAPLPVSVAARCAPARPISVLSVHGTADTSIPYGGGAFAGVGGGTTVLSAKASVARWAALNGCSTTPRQGSPASNVTTTSYSGCTDGRTVSLRSLVGGGHAWPPDIGTLVASALG